VKDQTTSQRADTIMLDFIASEYLDVSAFAMPTGAGDADVGWKLVQEHEGKKGRVEVACHYRDDLRAAIREAMQALGHSLPASDSADTERHGSAKAIPAVLSPDTPFDAFKDVAGRLGWDAEQEHAGGLFRDKALQAIWDSLARNPSGRD
jgi:hypothetical protein